MTIDILEIWWRKYLKCKRCLEIKELTPLFWIRDKGAKYWFVYRCKECMKEIVKDSARRYRQQHKTETHEYNIRYNREHRDEIREKRRANQKKENIIRKEYFDKHRYEINMKRNERVRRKWYWAIHQKTSYLIRKLWIRPKECSICWYNSNKIVAHHPDYNKIYDVIFCCNSCHKLIHSWEINPQNHIVHICDSRDGIQMVKCVLCWKEISNIAWTKYCENCKIKARRIREKRFRDKKKLLNYKNNNETY